MRLYSVPVSGCPNLPMPALSPDLRRALFQLPEKEKNQPLAREAGLPRRL